MKKLILVLAIVLMAAPAMASYYVAGDFNGWNAAGTQMTDLGNGIYSANLALGANERHEFKVTIGDWSDNWPWSGNSWFYTDASGALTITYDTNAYSDGWSASSKRIGISNDVSSWTAVGDWQGWNNSNAATKMTALGGGVYYYEQILTPGTHYYKAVYTGTWDAIGADSRSINADTFTFDTTETNSLAHFWVNASNGTAKVEVSAVPEPSSLFVLAAGLPFAFLRRRR